MEFYIYFYHTRGLNGILYRVEVSGGQQIGCFYHYITALGVCFGIGHVEVVARLFPDLEAMRITVSVVIIVGCAPKVWLDAETFIEIFLSVYLVRRNCSALLIKNEVHNR
ncbi:hypothetical protein SDC9_134880 [bioreactor metagenome]|uniref:Uncharacterized protein n=1 Tax=bioreactor metagenome TaxID=1076179 RepID=A0A645DE90_9ZZZZ